MNTVKYLITEPSKRCITTATHNFKWLKVTHICLILYQTFENPDVKLSFLPQ